MSHESVFQSFLCDSTKSFCNVLVSFFFCLFSIAFGLKWCNRLNSINRTQHNQENNCPLIFFMLIGTINVEIAYNNKSWKLIQITKYWDQIIIVEPTKPITKNSFQMKQYNIIFKSFHVHLQSFGFENEDRIWNKTHSGYCC